MFICWQLLTKVSAILGAVVMLQSFEWVQDKIEYRAVIKYLFLKGNPPTQIKGELACVYWDCAPTVKFWATEF